MKDVVVVEDNAESKTKTAEEPVTDSRENVIEVEELSNTVGIGELWVTDEKSGAAITFDQHVCASGIERGLGQLTA